MKYAFIVLIFTIKIIEIVFAGLLAIRYFTAGIDSKLNSIILLQNFYACWKVLK